MTCLVSTIDTTHFVIVTNDLILIIHVDAYVDTCEWRYPIMSLYKTDYDEYTMRRKHDTTKVAFPSRCPTIAYQRVLARPAESVRTRLVGPRSHV